MDGDSERSSKRRRLEVSHNVAASEIASSDQLYHLLQFRQSISSDVKAAITLFKDFLSKIAKSEDLVYQAQQLRILRQYCESQTAASKDALNFPDLISTWSFAVQSNNDSICSAVPAALAQFYKTISGILEFRDFGLQLGYSLLKHEHLRLFDRGLSAPKSRDYLVSPCLRLLTEIVSFDVGTLAGRVFDRREVLFKRLDFLLDQRNVETQDDRRKPSVRRMALRLVIANLKFLEINTKAEFAMHGRILRNCFQGLRNDGDDIVCDILKSLEVGFLDDKNLSKSVKSRVFSQDNLTALTELYNYETDPKYPDSTSKIRDTVHAFLIQVCTTRKGILLQQSGWFPVAFDTKLRTVVDDNYIDLGLDSPSYIDEYSENVPIRNAALSKYVQALKPEGDVLQGMLLVQILRSAPELVSVYFSKLPKFTSIQSEDPAWRSGFAFMFSVVQLPIPKNFGCQYDAVPYPPPVNIVLENLIPRTFDRTIFSKYFTSDDSILVLSAARLLITALEKLSNVLGQFQQRTESTEWQQASRKLVDATLQRVPKLPEIIASMQRIGKESNDVRLVLCECLALYHRVLPEATTGSKFDISAVLLDVIGQFNSEETTQDLKDVLCQQVLQLVTIADLSQSTRWWHKADTETLSLFSEMLKFLVMCAKDDVHFKVLHVLKSVSTSAGFLSNNVLCFTALQLSIASTKKFEAIRDTWLVLDNAIHRAIQRPVKYIDHIEHAQRAVSDKKPLSLLAASVSEQWEYVLNKHKGNKDSFKNIAEWIVRLYGALESVGENYRVMQQFQDDMLQVSPGMLKEKLQKAIDKGRKKPVVIDTVTAQPVHQISESHLKLHARPIDLKAIFGNPTSNPVSLEGIDRWDDKTDIELAIQSGKVAKLLRCATSPDEEVRRQAFQYLQILVHIADQSVYAEKVQIHLLLAEIVQTIRELGFEKPLSSAAAELSVCLLHIVADPAHKMYGKANKFLLRSPAWDLKRLIPLWMRQVLFQESETDEVGSWTYEIEWLIQWLIDGLKTSADMEIYRRSGVFEKILAIYTKPGLMRSVRRLVLTLIWYATYVDGAADTLITRVGILDWLHIVEMVDKEHQPIVQQLREHIRAASDVQAWFDDAPILRVNRSSPRK